MIRGAREHNLQSVDLEIPREKFVVITGISGSGKSSLAFDTIYAEGQRRYVESLSVYARVFLDQMNKPNVDSIEGLSPAISIEQKSASANPRSTVGTVTEILDYLRLLYARAGEPHCPSCGEPISSQTPQEMTERILERCNGQRIQVMAPIVRGRKGSYRKELEHFRTLGFVRVRIDGVLYDLAEEIAIARHSRHDIDVVIDRLVVEEKSRARLHDSLLTALDLADGLTRIDADGQGEPWLLSQNNACVTCGVSLPELTPRMFSFNNPRGACETCSGLGVEESFVTELIIPDTEKSLQEGAIAPWNKGANSAYYKKLLQALADHFGIEMDTPWRELPARVQKGILYGAGEEPVHFDLGKRKRGGKIMRTWDGVVGELERRAESGPRDFAVLGRYRNTCVCSACGGARLREESRRVRFCGQGIHELSQMPVCTLLDFLKNISVSTLQQRIAEPILIEVCDRLRFLMNVGLDYLTLDRRTASLSGGEAQRIRLATQIGSSLMGVLYILDEPSVGLHPRDNQRLLDSLLQLREMGNSVVVIEHDEATIRSADHVIDIGPGAGIHGGQIVAAGTPEQLEAHPDSITGRYLAGRARIALPTERRKTNGAAIVIKGCSANNLKNITLRIPLGCFTVMTGVSGSGKSTLVNHTLQRALSKQLHGSLSVPGKYKALQGAAAIDKVVDVDQAPIGRTPRSNPATYSGAFDGIRRLFSGVPEARVRGYGPGRFSFNVKGGRCDSCDGDGLLRVEMHFLPDLFVRCELCAGRRYNRETLEILYKEKSIADVLESTVEEAVLLFEHVGSVARPLRALQDVGLGYLRLGQSATTLSGGEAQRIKLAREFARRSTGSTLYLLDEPTTGLHFEDVKTLLELLHRLVEMGNTVLVIEHNLDVMKVADHIVDLGPEGGEGGGEIVAEGTPEEVCREARSLTGHALTPVLEAHGI